MGTAKISVLTTSTDIIGEVLGNAIRQEKKNKEHTDKKVKSKTI